MNHENETKEIQQVEDVIAEASASVQCAIEEAVETVEAAVEDVLEKTEVVLADEVVVAAKEAICVGGRLDGRMAPYKDVGDKLEFTTVENGKEMLRHYLLVESDGSVHYKYVEEAQPNS